MSPKRTFSTIGLRCLAFIAAAALSLSVQAAEPKLADNLEENLRAPFTGDFDEIIERGFVRVLIPFSKTGYFIDKGEQRGSTVDIMREFGKFLDKTYGKKTKDLYIVLIP
ncbi:MAG: hypothetical protein AAGA50_31420, partial [Pseudomonadota bacterium]